MAKMKLKIRGEDEMVPEVPEVEVWLERTSKGKVTLRAGGYYIASLVPETGKLMLHGGIGPAAHLALQSGGYPTVVYGR